MVAFPGKKCKSRIIVFCFGTMKNSKDFLKIPLYAPLWFRYTIPSVYYHVFEVERYEAR